MSAEAAPPSVEVLVMAPHLGEVDYVAAADRRVRAVDGGPLLVAEAEAQGIPSPWPRRDGERLPPREERDALLAAADVLILGFPVPPDLLRRAPRVRWVHHTQAGVSNLHGSDVWTSPVLLTSSRGHVAVTAIAEYVLAAALTFGRGLDRALRAGGDGSAAPALYEGLRTLDGGTMGIVGLGGIGREVARLAKAFGMRVVATRRSVPAAGGGSPDGDADVVLPPEGLEELAAQSDVVAVCAMLTAETRGLVDARVLAAMKPTAILVNVARGELVDHAALAAAVREGRIRGAVLDVYPGDMRGEPPPRELVGLPRIVVTPHVSGNGYSKEPQRALIAENLRRFLAGEELVNEVDRARGY